jgi:hypothetical protein
MEAPKKIYIQRFNVSEEDAKFKRVLYFDDVWTEEPEPGCENVEYTRTDAFIEKACEFLANDANIPLWEGYNDTFGCDTSRLVNNFKKYMKGE